MAFFLHCNNCLALSNDEQLYMLSCQHMFCKGCMQHSENGKICPMCKQNVRILELSKLPEDVKFNFLPVMKILQRPAKAIKFQQSYQRNMLKLTINYKHKCLKAEKAYNELKGETIRMKQQLEKLVERRKLMQSKLKQIYLSNQKKKPSQVYRSQANSFTTAESSGTSSRGMAVNNNSPDASSFFSNSGKGLLGKHSSRMITPETSSNLLRSRRLSSDSFTRSPNVKQRRYSINSSQADRSPFFA